MTATGRECIPIDIMQAKRGTNAVVLSRYNLPPVTVERRNQQYVARGGRATVTADYCDGALAGKMCAGDWICFWDTDCAPEHCEAEVRAQAELSLVLLTAAERLGCHPGDLAADVWPWGFRVFLLED